ncbi:ATP-binding protein [Parvibaculum sp.]|uniref:ATP-binding protein n=1 Tax=Parvibaculum sp. TaxID=2024848 RepID=UPI002CF09BC5|nr:ATP-binding protein [Parvibaculum sp.]HUD51605.1 ATP-binding protein [Parvibaculum sp.]
MPITAARALAEPVEPIGPRVLCADVFDRLLAEPDLLNIPVVDEGRPVGLLSRQDFMLVYVRLYGREIYGRQPVTALMNKTPVVVDAAASCDDINARLVDLDGSSPLQGFIVVEGGRYIGIGSSVELMRVMAEINMRRAEELERQRRRAEAASESKTQFLAGMSHELRTPLNAIIGFADLMRLELFGKIEPECYVEYVRDIHGSGVHLLHMINELLDMAKIEAGRFDLHEDVLHPAEMCDEVARMLRQSIETARVRLDIRVAKELPRMVADEQQIRRILVNLLSNAIKFTPAGGRITLSVAERADGGLELAVADTGIGIPPDKIEKVLEPFEQVENSFTRTRAGTGLGLPLTKAMVEAHGGRLRIESILDKGTRVRAFFPPERVLRTSETDAA